MGAPTKAELAAQVEELRRALDEATARAGRLQADLAAAADRHAATTEILQAISATSAEAEPVFEAIAESALRLLGAWAATVWRYEDGLIRAAAVRGGLPGSAEMLRQQRGTPGPLVEGSPSGRTVLTRAVQHSGDVDGDPTWSPQFRTEARMRGFRSIVTVPMLHGERVMGVIAVTRQELGGFAPEEIALLQTFADQAVIAIENARLFAEIHHGLEQQTATSEILRVISGSPTDVQPVFEAIVESASRLCAAAFSAVSRVGEDGLLHLVALNNMSPEETAAFHSLFPRPVGREFIMGRAFLEGRPVHVEDVLADPDYDPRTRSVLQEVAGYRTFLAVPILKDGVPIGVVGSARREVKPFTPVQIDLVKTFADQAGIAIENVRQFKELQTRNRDLTDALDRQTATAEILRVVSQAQADVQPVFDTIARSAARLCEATDAHIWQREGDRLRVVASLGSLPMTRQELTISRQSVVGRAVSDRRAVHVEDLAAVFEEEFPDSWGMQGLGYRTILAMPLVREGESIGAIMIRRTEVRPFSRGQVALLETFADQAVIAIGNARLLNELQARNADLTESLEQQTATSEILRVISSSPTDIQPVLDTVTSSAARLCESFDTAIFFLDGDRLRLAAHLGPILIGPIGEFTLPLLRGIVGARSVLDGRTIHVADMQTEGEEFPESSENARGMGFRTILCVPLMREGVAIGWIQLRRTETRLFTERHVALLETFADQAVIAIENVRLFKELEARNRELRVALEQQTATSEVLKVISRSTFDLQPVLDTLVENATRLAGAEGALIARFDGDVFRFLAEYGASPEFSEFWRRNVIRPGRGSAIGRAAIERRTVHIVDALTDPEWEQHEAQRAGGYRSVLAIPMVRGADLIGLFFMWRTEVRAFTDKQVDLVATFADQAVIAIENARLLSELRGKNADLTEALEQQTATAEILRVISGSPTDVQPVFETIVRSAVQLSGARTGALYQFDGDLLHLVAHHNQPPAALAALQQAYPMRPTRAQVSGRAIFSAAVEEIPDLRVDPEYQQDIAAVTGWQSLLGVPMLRGDGAPIGVIVIQRVEPGRFATGHVELLKTFADQAVIAVENVRLFTELGIRNRDLSSALDRQTATAEILRAISQAQADVQPVFEAIAESAMRLFEAWAASVFRFDGEFLRRAVSRGGRPGSPEVVMERDRAPRRPVNTDPAGRTALTGAVQHVVDADTESAFGPAFREEASLRGFRSLITVPMLRGQNVIGVIGVGRDRSGGFTPAEIALLETFADQAVIAVENARLLTELQAKNADLTEALEQQTATSEVLRVISSSPTDVQPVFDAIVESAVRLCETMAGALLRFDGDTLHPAAVYGPAREEILRAWEGFFPYRPGPEVAIGQAVLERRVINIEDVMSLPRNPLREATQRSGGYRAYLAVPMLHEGNVIGVIASWRAEPRAFSDRQVRLMQTFADQAVIAIENVRLFTELEERNGELRVALEQQTATSELLKVIGRSTFDLLPVFETLAENAVRLCEAERALVYRFDGEALRVVATHNVSREIRAFVEQNPIAPGQGSTSARAALQRRTVHVRDIQADPEYTYGARQIDATRTMVAVPMLRVGELLGVITIYRLEVQPFTDSQIALMETFADQAAIAIENARLLTELQAKNADLTEALEQQTATAEILRVISRSPTDVQPVFDIIGERAEKLCEAEISVVSRVDGELIHLVALHGVTGTGVEAVRSVFPMRRSNETVTARAVRNGAVVHVEDVLHDAEYENKDTARTSGYRGCLGVPMLRDGEVIGVIFVARREPGYFSDAQVELLKTFADQAVIAIENVRLFKELEERNGELRISLEQQTATGEILRAISTFQTDVQPVFDAIAAKALDLCRATTGWVYRFDGELIHIAAAHSLRPEAVEVVRQSYPAPPSRGGATARAVLSRAIVYIPDIREDREYRLEALARSAVYLSVVAVPMLLEGKPIGVITVTGAEAAAFSQREIELLQTFADQAVIAVENARLLSELQARTAELTRSVQELQALGEVGQALTSTLDLDTVLNTIVSRASQLAGTDSCTVYEYDEQAEAFVFRATHNLAEEVVGGGPARPDPTG